MIVDAGLPAHPIARLARLAVESYVREGVVVNPPAVLAPAMSGRAGVFVSLKKRGELRGCIGTFEPARSNIAEEVIRNAISSATQDPRFPPVRPTELSLLAYSVDVLTTPVPVSDFGDLDPRRYGVIVVCGSRRGLLLPDIEGVETVSRQLEICRAKAGITMHEAVNILQFEVRRYH